LCNQTENSRMKTGMKTGGVIISVRRYYVSLRFKLSSDWRTETHPLFIPIRLYPLTVLFNRRFANAPNTIEPIPIKQPLSIIVGIIRGFIRIAIAPRAYPKLHNNIMLYFNIIFNMRRDYIYFYIANLRQYLRLGALRLRVIRLRTALFNFYDCV